MLLNVKNDFLPAKFSKSQKCLLDISSTSSNSSLKEKHEDSNAIVDHMSNIQLKSIRIKNLNKIVIGHLNINSLRNKFDFLVTQVKGSIDILMISETKTDNSFPTMQFHIEGYCIYRLDRHEYGGGILVYVREDIPSKLIPMQSSSIEGFFIELNLRCKKS